MRYTYSGRGFETRWSVGTFSSIPVQDYMMMVTDIVEGCFEGGRYIPANTYRAKALATIYYFTDCSSYLDMWKLVTCTDIISKAVADSNGVVEAAWADADREIKRRVKGRGLQISQTAHRNYVNWSIPNNTMSGDFLEWKWPFHRSLYLRERLDYERKYKVEWSGHIEM